MNRLIHEIQKRQGIQTIFWILILAVLWEAFSRLGWINAYLLPSFSTVLRATYAEVAAGRYLFQVLNSFYMILLGFAISAALALVIITLCIWSKVIHSFVKSLCILLAPLPGVAIMPIIILLFGIDTKAMVVLMVHSVLWPLTMNALSGIQTIPKTIVEYAKNIQLPKAKMFLNVYIFAIMPCILTGLKIGWGRAWRALISAEMVFGMIGSLGGIGYYIYTNRAYGNMTKVMVGVISVVIIGVVVEHLFFGLIEKATVKKWGMIDETGLG